MRCLDDLHIDTPTKQIWAACMNPLMIPQSCRTKGVHPPTKEKLKEIHAFNERIAAIEADMKGEL